MVDAEKRNCEKKRNLWRKKKFREKRKNYYERNWYVCDEIEGWRENGRRIKEKIIMRDKYVQCRCKKELKE